MTLKDKKMMIIVIVICVFIIVSVFFVFSGGKSKTAVVEEYFHYLQQKEYKKMYEMLDKKTLNGLSKNDFLKKYQNIYEGLEAKNIRIKIIEEKGDEVEYKIQMNTVAGKVEYKNKVTFLNGMISYNYQLIFDGVSQNHKIKVLTERCQRGKIIDRNGNVLAGQGVGFSVGLVKGKLRGEEDYKKIADFLDIDVETIQKKMSASWIRDDSFVPIKDISKDKKDEIMNQGILAINGVKINTIEIRDYPFGKMTSHVTGYMQKVNADDLKKHKDEGYNENSMIGRSGIEAAYEKQLKGQDGKSIVVVDENNKLIKTIAEKKVKYGQDIELTIDIDLQKDLYNEYQNDKSASVALNPQTGEILALVSTPSFLSQDFILGMTSKQWNALNGDENKPLTNRFKAIYTPGSSMKPITAAIGLDAGVIDPDKDLGAKEKWQKDSSWGSYYVTTLHAPSPNHLKNAIVYSDNVYFARTATKIGKKKLTESYDHLKIGEKIPFELSLNISQYQNKNSGFTDQMLADSGYGQGELLMNPVQLATIYSSFINEGTVLQPYLVKDNKLIQPWIKNAFTKDTANIIKEDLIAVIEDSHGTGHQIYREDIRLAGKTGTAEIKISQNDMTGTELGWFTVMTVDNKQPVVITTMVEDVKERGGSGYVVEHMKKPLNNYLQ